MHTPSAAEAATPLSDDEIGELQQQLDDVPTPLEPLDISALDGYLCGVLLQPRPVPLAQWLPGVTDLDGRALPAGYDPTPLHTLVQRRHAEIDRAIARRDWFDPWIFQLDEEASPSDAVLPWVAGFAAAQDRCPALMASDDPTLVEPLALLYLHFEEAMPVRDIAGAWHTKVEHVHELRRRACGTFRACLLRVRRGGDTGSGGDAAAAEAAGREVLALLG